jgi:23S rRNA (uracil1939-C5)-methyltransferase
MNIKKGDEVLLKIETLAFEGKAIARMEGCVVFVNDAVPGDTVRAVITKVKTHYLEARNVELLERSDLRVEPRCRYVGSCGGCKMQHIDYAAQLKLKHRHVIDSFERIGKMKDVEIPAPIGAENIFFYRNKMEFSFSDQRWLTSAEIESGEDYDRNFALGLHVPGRYDKVIDIGECWLQSEISNRILGSIRKSAKELGIKPYTTRSHDGFLRFLVIKQSRATGEVMVNIVTSDNREDVMQPVIKRLRTDVPEVTTIVNNINRRKAQIAVGDEEITYYGEGYITERIGGYMFRISANSFFQTNTAQAEKLFSVGKEFGELSRDDVVLDLYSGTGTITIYLSDAVRLVYGIESVDDAVNDAQENARLNGSDNVRFVRGDVLEKLRSRHSWLEEEPTVLYLDPPRSGIHPGAIREIIDLRLPKIVYISCNPVTQARDLAALVDNGYRIDRVQPVDMFPHTYHVENVARLSLFPSHHYRHNAER